MGFRNVTRNLIFSWILIQGIISTVAADTRLGKKVIPVFESIVLKLDPAQTEYTGSVKIELEVKEETDIFHFHSEGLDLTRLEISRKGESVPSEYDIQGGSLVEVRTGKPISVGPLLLEIDFSNSFDTTANSLYRMESGGLWYTFSQFESDEARGAFPCWDEPIFKIPFQVTLVVPDVHLALTNTPDLDVLRDNGWKRITFEKTRPLPTYLLAVATGPLETVPIPGMSVPGRSGLAGEAVKTTPRILAGLEKYFGQPYPFKKLDLIAVPKFWYGAMENPGAVTYSERILLLEPNTANARQRRSLASVTAHELAHMWFGDLVTMEWWDDIWLNEAFASWVAGKVVHEIFPEYGLDVNQVRKAQRAMITDARPSTRAIRQPVESSDNLLLAADVLAYSKGEAVLKMFESWLGADTFRKGIISYLESNAWGSATADDLWSTLSEVSGKDVTSAMATFLDHGGVPLVSVAVFQGNQLVLRQERFSNYGVTAPEENQWKIPVVLRYSKGDVIQRQKVFLTETESTVQLDTVGDIGWILPNDGMKGYYRWSLPPEMLGQLVLSSTEIMDTRERVGFIGNLSALLDAGMITGDSYLEALNAFADDPDPKVISALLSAMEKVREAFITGDLEEAFAVYVRRTLGPALKRFGLAGTVGENEEITRFRPLLIGWLADEGRDERLLAYADSLTEEYMKDPAAIDPSLADIVLDLSAHHGDRALFDECRDQFESSRIPRERSRYLYMLGCFRDPDLVEAALEYALEGPLRPMEVFTIPRAIRDESDNDDRLFRWMMDNYETIAPRMPIEFVSYFPLFASGCSRDRLEEAKRFFADPRHNVSGIDQQLAKVSDQVNDCAGLREREGDTIAAYLEEFMSR